MEHSREPRNKPICSHPIFDIRAKIILSTNGTGTPGHLQAKQSRNNREEWTLHSSQKLTQNVS